MSEHKNLKLARKRKSKVRPRIVRRWHRRLGLLSALAVLLLSVTGLMLNHVSQLYSPNSYVSSKWVLDWYGVQAPVDVISYTKTGSASFIWADGTLLVNEKPLFFNQDEFLGVYDYKGVAHLFTASELHLFTRSGEFVESIDLQSTNQIESIHPSTNNNVVELRTNNGSSYLDLDNLLFNQTIGRQTARPDNNQSLATELKRHSPQDDEVKLARQNLFLKSTVLLDVHSGRFFGSWGALLMDFFAICFLLLAASGIIAWRRGLARS